MPWSRRIPLIRFISTASSWPRATPACFPCRRPAEFLNRLEHLYNTSSRKPRMILISFPHNPTTHCVDLQFFRDIVALAARHGTMIVHDFAYADLGFDGYEPPSILQVDGAKEIAVEIYSMSKSFNMAGWRVGFCLGNKKMIGSAGAHQELSRLRRLPAHPDRVHHRAARVRQGHREDPQRLSEAPRRADHRARSRGLAGGAAARDHVRVGADSGEVSRQRVARILEAAAWKKRWWPCRRASDSGRSAKATCVSRSSRTSTGPGRLPRRFSSS